MGTVEKSPALKPSTRSSVRDEEYFESLIRAQQFAVEVTTRKLLKAIKELVAQKKQMQPPPGQIGYTSNDDDNLALDAMNWLMSKNDLAVQELSEDIEAKDFDDALKVVNPLLARSAERLGEAALARALNLAEMEARADRIDRTQAESRAIIDSLFA